MSVTNYFDVWISWLFSYTDKSRYCYTCVNSWETNNKIHLAVSEMEV